MSALVTKRATIFLAISAFGSVAIGAAMEGAGSSHDWTNPIRILLTAAVCAAVFEILASRAFG